MIFNYLKNRQLKKANTIGHAENGKEIVFFVTEKKHTAQLDKKDRLPRWLLWRRCKVQEMKKPSAQKVNLDRQVQRFGSGGVTGTLGLVVTKVEFNGWAWSSSLFEHFGADLEDFGIEPEANKYVLTNMHVAHESLEPTGDETYGQPSAWVASARAFGFHKGNKEKDCALLKPITQKGHDWIAENEIPFEQKNHFVGMEVEKTGRTTDRTEGIVTHTKVNVAMDYLTGTVIARNCFVVKSTQGKAFSKKGDSGSVVWEKDKKNVVGLLIGGTDEYSIIYPIKDVFKKLDVI